VRSMNRNASLRLSSSAGSCFDGSSTAEVSESIRHNEKAIFTCGDELDYPRTSSIEWHLLGREKKVGDEDNLAELKTWRSVPGCGKL